MRFAVIANYLVCLFVTFLISSNSFAANGADELDDIRHVLLLNSYHQRMTWVKDIVRGVEDVLRPEENKLTLHIENMDTKVFHSPEYFMKFKEYLQVKYRETSFSLILSSDNNAYDFLRYNRDVLFKNVPVSFCGVNDFSEAQLNGISGFTGVAEIFSAKETVSIALQLHPDTTEILVINDFLKTGRAWARDIEKKLHGQVGDVLVRHSKNLSIHELMNEISALPPTALVLFGVYFSDRDGRYFTYERIGAMLSEASNVPVYCLLEFNVGKGVMGGQVISGLSQGKAMAEIGMKILNGYDPDSIPVRMEGSNRLIFDYQQLVRFGIEESKLPDGSFVINKPYSFYNAYKVQVWIVMAFIVALLVAILALVINVMKRTNAESELRESEERFRQLANASWEAIIIHEKGILSHANDYFYEMFGYTAEELEGKQILPLILASESLEEVIGRVDKGTIHPYEAMGFHKNGSTFPIEVHVRQMRSEGREVRMSAIRDLSERKRLESRIAQSQKLEAIGTLAGGIAHDFNNILSAIMGYSELSLTQLQGNPKIEHNIGEVLRAGHRAKDLVQQILTFARKAKEEKRPVQVALIIKEALKLLRASLPSSIEIKSDIASNGFVLSDTTQMHQIMMNLCTNAGKAMANGGVLTIVLEEACLQEEDVKLHHLEVKPGQYLRLTVQDTGEGIPAELQERIFDPFFTTRTKGEGTGLGLSVVHGIVEDCKGCITLESEVGRGSTFNVYLPLIEGHNSNEFNGKGELPKGTESILFVDDEAAIVEMADNMLASLGYTVTGFTSSLDALGMFRQQPDAFDLVITDMTMPRMNGDRLARELLDLKPELPIIICTGYSEQITEEEAIKMGIRSYIMKPVVMNTLARTIRIVLETK